MSETRKFLAFLAADAVAFVRFGAADEDRAWAKFRSLRSGGRVPKARRRRLPVAMKSNEENGEQSERPGGAPPEIADWLEELGLGRYASAFVENDIDFAVLPDLSDADLRELGDRLSRPSQTLAGRDRSAKRGPSAGDGGEGRRAARRATPSDHTLCRSFGVHRAFTIPGRRTGS